MSTSTTTVGGFCIYFALLFLTFASTSTAAKEINPCVSLTPFTRDYGGDAPFAVPFRSMVVFGDSYSDTGNIYWSSNHKAPKPGQSWNGRFADGPVWVDYFAAYFLFPELVPRVTNYAWGGAFTKHWLFSGIHNGFVPAVSKQVRLYIANRSLIDDDVLHVIFSGYNDYYYTVGLGYPGRGEQNQDQYLHSVALTVVRSIVNSMSKLYESGARKFMVMDMHDMTKTPDAINKSVLEKDAYTILITNHNSYLEEYINEFTSRRNDTIVYRPSTYESMDCIDKEKNSLGFYDTQHAFYDDDADVNYPIFTYKWWDAVHPTTHSHHQLSTRAIQAVFDHHQMEDSSLIGLTEM